MRSALVAFALLDDDLSAGPVALETPTIFSKVTINLSIISKTTLIPSGLPVFGLAIFASSFVSCKRVLTGAKALS